MGSLEKDLYEWLSPEVQESYNYIMTTDEILEEIDSLICELNKKINSLRGSNKRHNRKTQDAIHALSFLIADHGLEIPLGGIVTILDHESDFDTWFKVYENYKKNKVKK